MFWEVFCTAEGGVTLVVLQQWTIPNIVDISNIQNMYFPNTYIPIYVQVQSDTTAKKWQNERQWAQTEMLKKKKNIFYCEGGQTLEQVAQGAWWSLPAWKY